MLDIEISSQRKRYNAPRGKHGWKQMLLVKKQDFTRGNCMDVIYDMFRA